jgi:hypothetical protein
MNHIIFSTPMVQAVLEDRKNMTRRVAKVNNPEDWEAGNNCRASEYGAEVPCYITRKMATEERGIHYPKYDAGDILWVKETWGYSWFAETDGEAPIQRYIFRADENSSVIRWRSSLFMPRAAARIFLRVTDVRVERVQEITDADAVREGFSGVPCEHPFGRYACEDCMNTGWLEPPTVGFMETWEKLNAKRGYGWDTNPWVWVISFERISKEEAEAVST